MTSEVFDFRNFLYTILNCNGKYYLSCWKLVAVNFFRENCMPPPPLPIKFGLVLYIPKLLRSDWLIELDWYSETFWLVAWTWLIFWNVLISCWNCTDILKRSDLLFELDWYSETFWVIVGAWLILGLLYLGIGTALLYWLAGTEAFWLVVGTWLILCLLYLGVGTALLYWLAGTETHWLAGGAEYPHSSQHAGN